MNRPATVLILLACLALSVAGCASSEDSNASDAGQDVAVDRGLDRGGNDPAVDTGGQDVPVDTGTDTVIDDAGDDDQGGDDTGADDTGDLGQDDATGDDASDLGEDDATGDDTDAEADAEADTDADAEADADTGADAEADTGIDAEADTDADAADAGGVAIGDPCSTLVDDCGTELVCIVAGTETDGFCAPESCTSFYLDECGPDAHCIVFDGEGACVVAGDGIEGSVCATQNDCQVGTLCVDAECTNPECSADNLTETCPVIGDTCIPYVGGDAELDVGSCITPCTPFATEQCDAGEFCAPFDRDDTGELFGSCVPEGDGTVIVGGGCTTDACVDGAVCLDLDDGNGPTCFATCDPEVAGGETGACTGLDEACFPLFDDEGNQLLIGFCSVGCEAFVEPGVCDEGDWCEPDLFDATVGECVPDTGTAMLGDACGEQTGACCQATLGTGGCAADAGIEACVCAIDPFCCDTEWDGVCVGIAEDSCSAVCTLPPEQECEGGLLCLGGTCEELCDQDARGDSPGTCGPGDGCGLLSIGGTPLDIGYCTESCDFHGDTDGCDDVDDYCQAAETLAESFDICLPQPGFFPDADGLDVGEQCPADAAFGTFCGPGKICVDDGAGGFECDQLCFTSEGDFGTAADCDSGVCTDSLGLPDVGLCE